MYLPRFLETLTAGDGAPRATPQEMEILRCLGRRKAEILATDTVAQRVRLWKKHHALQGERPMLLVFPEGSWAELIAADPALQCRCADPVLRWIEQELRIEIYAFDHFDTDNVPNPPVWVPKAIGHTGWGVEARWHDVRMERGAKGFNPVITDEAGLEQLRFPEVFHHAEVSRRRHEAVAGIFDGILPVESVGIKHVSFHLMAQWSALRGLEEMMVDMIAEPEFTHRAIAFLAEGQRRLVEQYETLGLLEHNHDNTYHSSGGNGWLESPPGPPVVEGAPVRRANLWASAEAQELTGVSPEMHDEFALRYERELLAPFALTGYGCCEDISSKVDRVLELPHMRRISISPFSDTARTSPAIGPRAISSWKPRPTDLVGTFQPERLHAYLRENLDRLRAADCRIEVILKDTHTCDNHPERFDQWCRIARKEIARVS
jgi:hypothetical protein